MYSCGEGLKKEKEILVNWRLINEKINKERKKKIGKNKKTQTRV